MTNTATIQLNADSRQVKEAANDLDGMADSAAKAELETKELEARTKKLAAAELKLISTTSKLNKVTDRLAKETDEAKRAELKLKAATLEASGAQQAASISAQKLAQNQSKMGNGAVVAGKKMGLMRSRVQQVGFQVQDFAVQLQGGTSAFVAFGQQGSQLAGAFGPGGAIIGAFIAIGSIIGGVLASQMANAGNAVDDLIDRLRDGTEELEKLGDAQKRVFRREQLILISDTEEKVESYKEKIKEAEATLSRLQNATAGMGVSQFLLDREIAKSTETLDDLNSGREAEVKTLAAQKQLLSDVAAGVSKESKAVEERNKKRSQAAFSRVSRTGASPAIQALNEFEARKKVIDEAQKNEVATQMQVDLARAVNARVLQEDLTAIAKQGIDERSKLEQASFNAQVGAAGQIAGNLAQIAKAGGKDQFDNYKAFASAQAAINAGLAISGVLAQSAILGPLAIPLSVTIGALAAVQIAQIQSQEFQPRRHGGQMRAGGVIPCW